MTDRSRGCVTCGLPMVRSPHGHGWVHDVSLRRLLQHCLRLALPITHPAASAEPGAQAEA
jgi:hypothetical protein